MPGKTIESFSTRLGESLDKLMDLELNLRRQRRSLVDLLHTAVHNATKEKRQVLLAIKRDSFNNRSLRRYRDTGSWLVVMEAAGQLAETIIGLETECEREEADFASAYNRELVRQQELLITLAQDQQFRCGLAIATPIMCQELHRLMTASPACYGRKEKRLLISLLRYLTRAALKLSPFSTFTCVGIAEVEAGDAPLTISCSSVGRRSLLRLQPEILDRCFALLSQHGPFRDLCQVKVNDAMVQLESGECLCHKAAHFRIEPTKQAIEYAQDCLVRFHARGAADQCIRQVESQGAIRYRELIQLLAGISPDLSEMDRRKYADKLIELGALQLLPPWNTTDEDWEKKLLSALQEMNERDCPATFKAALAQVLQLRTGFPSQGDPVEQVAELSKAIDCSFRAAASDIGFSLATNRPQDYPKYDIYQDVWCTPVENSDKGLVRVGKDPLETAVRSVAPLAAYTRVFDYRVEFLLTLGALMQKRGGRPWNTLEAFASVQRMFRECIGWSIKARKEGLWPVTWNPLSLVLIEQLANHRQIANEYIQTCILDLEGERHIVPDLLKQLISKIPPRFTEVHSGMCLFLQPASADGSLWILNCLKEGTGRFGSRYGPVMPADQRRRFTAQLTHNGRCTVRGEQVELLDVQYVQGNTSNIHMVQTPKVTSVDPNHGLNAIQSSVKLRDLFITLDNDGWPELRDDKGQRYIPAYLGLTYHDYLPTFVKFLCAFGPTELSSVFPAPAEHETDGVTIGARTTIGNVVLHRGYWRVPIQEMRQHFAGGSDIGIYRHLHQWRRLYRIPEKGFIMERVPHPIRGFTYRPQYCDFSSPLFIPILRTVVERAQADIKINEMLPSSEMLPRNPDGETWAVELLVDSLTMGEMSLAA